MNCVCVFKGSLDPGICVWCKYTHSYICVYWNLCVCFSASQIVLISCTDICNYVKLDIHNFANGNYKTCQNNASIISTAVYNMFMRAL